MHKLMDKLIAVEGRILITTETDVSEVSDLASNEILKSAQRLKSLGNSVIICCEGNENVIDYDGIKVFSTKHNHEAVLRVFKPALVLCHTGKSRFSKLAGAWGNTVKAVPGSTKTTALKQLSQQAQRNKFFYTSAEEERIVSANKPSKEIELTTEPTWFTFEVTPLAPHKVKAQLNYQDKKDQTQRGCVARIKYFDSDGNELKGPFSGLAQSKMIGDFSYLPPQKVELLNLMPPKEAVKVKLGFHRWNANNKVTVSETPVCECLVKTPSLTTSSKSKPQGPAKKLAKLKVMGILDEFTHECFSHEVNLVSPTPDNWRELIERNQPDLLFVESCWFGNSNTWSGLIYGYSSNGPNQMEALVELISYCKSEGIPTVFWAKEDPVHFSRFAPTAKLFDYVFTTDANIVSEYDKQYGIEAQALPFFCQPRIHNPLQNVSRAEKSAFAGSYYSDKVERCNNFHTIMDTLFSHGIDVDIYDRCFDRGVVHLTFPEKYSGKVIGSVAPSDMWKVYKGYRYTINLNTVKHSPTMFARRVYESLACGTPVISNYSEGVRTQFGGIVCASDSADEIAEYVDKLSDEKVYNQVARLGAREALSRHTLANRLETVCERIGISIKPHLPLMNLEITASTEDEVEQARTLFEKQSYLRKRLVVNLENSNVLYPYLNQNTQEEIFRVKTEFAKPLSGKIFAHQLEQSLDEFALEDAAIATQYEPIDERICKEVSA